eukprot:4139270-Pyramimonas_sp.AAC.1
MSPQAAPEGQSRQRLDPTYEHEGVPLRILLIDNYDSYTFNLFQQIAVVNHGAPQKVLQLRPTS